VSECGSGLWVDPALFEVSENRGRPASGKEKKKLDKGEKGLSRKNDDCEEKHEKCVGKMSQKKEGFRVNNLTAEGSIRRDSTTASNDNCKRNVKCEKWAATPGVVGKKKKKGRSKAVVKGGGGDGTPEKP